jgi:Uncharacterised protein family (UPF0158)
MEDFVGRVRDPRSRDLLERAIAGRGAFRRFKDTLLDFPDLRQAWFSFHGARMERLAIEWLAGQGLIQEQVAAQELQARQDPEHPQLGGRFDPAEAAAAVAGDLRRSTARACVASSSSALGPAVTPTPSRTSTCSWSSTGSTRPGTSSGGWTRSSGATPTGTAR